MRLLCSSFLLFVMLGTQAQILDWGIPQKLASRNFYCKFIGFNTDGYYYIRCKKADFKNEVTIEKYSRTLNLVWSKSINTRGVGELVQQVLLLNTKILIITSDDNYTTGFTELKAHELSFVGELGAIATNLFQIKTAGFYSNEADDKFVVRINQERTLFLVGSVTQSEKKHVSLNYSLFAETLDNIGSGGYTYNSKTDRFFINDILVHNLTIYCLVSYSEWNKNYSEAVYLHDLITMNNTLKSSSRVPLLLEGKVQSDLGIHIDTLHNSIQLTGFYSEKKSTSAAGVALYTLPLDNPKNYTAAYTPFPKELIAKIIGERASERVKEVEDFVVHKIVPRSDGGLLLIAECFYIEKQPYNSYTSGIQGITPQPTIFRNVYNYDEVLLFSIDSNAAIDWWQVITKNQNSMNDDGYNLSIATLIKKEMIYIFYNRNYHNSNEILEYSINSNGKMKNKILFKSTNYYIDFAPRECQQIATGSILMPIIKDRKFNLLKLTY